MKDWADKIELTIADAYSSHGAILAADADGMIAAALRKAVDDERKLIAKWLSDPKDITSACGGFDPWLIDYISDVIERGEYKKGQLMDWAEKIAINLKLTETADDDVFKVSVEGLASALRKAKSDGMRLVANTAGRYENWTIKEIASDINTRANEIEKGQ